jgi:hypothetical protein
VSTLQSANGQLIQLDANIAQKAPSIQGSVSSVQGSVQKLQGSIQNLQSTDIKLQGGSLQLQGARAGGGPVKAGCSYLVGEEGMEIFTPKQDGMIIPNDKLTQGGSSSASMGASARPQIDFHPEINVNVGMYAGMPVEKRAIAEDLWSELVRSAKAQGVVLPSIGSVVVQ